MLLIISSRSDNPLSDFPFDINRNHFVDVMKQAPDVMNLILKLSTKNEVPIEESDVIRVAYMFSSLATSVSSSNNALKKTKSVFT